MELSWITKKYIWEVLSWDVKGSSVSNVQNSEFLISQTKKPQQQRMKRFNSVLPVYKGSFQKESFVNVQVHVAHAG